MNPDSSSIPVDRFEPFDRFRETLYSMLTKKYSGDSLDYRLSRSSSAKCYYGGSEHHCLDGNETEIFLRRKEKSLCKSDELIFLMIINSEFPFDIGS